MNQSKDPQTRSVPADTRSTEREIGTRIIVLTNSRAIRTSRRFTMDLLFMYEQRRAPSGVPTATTGIAASQ